MVEKRGRQTEQGGLRKQLVRMIQRRVGVRRGRARDAVKGGGRGKKKKGRCKRLMRESEKLILTSLWAGRLRKIRKRVREEERWGDNFYHMP